MNPVEIKLASNEIVEDLSKYKRFSLLFSSNLRNDTNIIFITCNGLSDEREALINSKLYKTLVVVYLSQIKNWDLVKCKSKRSQAVFDSGYHTKSSHYGFVFITKNVSDLFNFTITLLDGKGNKITFPSNKMRVPVIGFKIQIVK